MLIALVIALLADALLAVMAAAETAVMVLAPGRVHRLTESERPGALALLRLAQRPHRLRATSGLVAGFAFGVSAIAGWLVGATFVSGSALLAGEIAGALASLIVVFSACAALPRTLAVTNPEAVGLASAQSADAACVALYPLARALGAPWKWAFEIAGAERVAPAWATGAEFRSAAEVDEDAEREVAEEALLEAVSDFAEKVVREVMVPRTDMTALPDDATVSDAVEVIERTGYTRLPVYADTVDDVRGVLYAKDLLTSVCDGRADVRVIEIARPAHFVPETKPVEELLREMRRSTHIAIVADEYGGTAGLVTLEDLLEEIVGEISDEYDEEEQLVADLGDGSWRVDARLPVDDLNEIFGTELETEADSVGGLFTQVAGRIPHVGESIEVEGLRLTVSDLQGTRIIQLVVTPAQGAGTEGESHA